MLLALFHFLSRPDSMYKGSDAESYFPRISPPAVLTHLPPVTGV
jgi:hypothetical protein